MAKKWIKAATSKNKGAFTAKAEAAGKSVAEYAEEKKDASGTLGKEARLAQTLRRMHHAKDRYSPKKAVRG